MRDFLYDLHLRVGLSVEVGGVDSGFLTLTQLRNPDSDQIKVLLLVFDSLIVVMCTGQKVRELKIGIVRVPIFVTKND